MNKFFKTREKQKAVVLFLSAIFFSTVILGQNPFITNQYRADPTARVFNGKLFLYPSSDAVCEKGEGNNGFCMPNYHVYSTTDLTAWTDHGEIISHNTVPWVKPNSNGMWAPDCNFKNGKYYFYFPAMPKDGSNFRNIGVAIADNPEGPFIPQENYMKGVTGIDPNVFVDDDGRAYLYYGGGENLYGVELNDDMVSVKGKPIVIQKLPSKYKEGPFVFKRKGVYYFTFPHSPDGSEEISYAMGKSPLGPFNYKGKVLERWKDGCWTNHHSFVEFKNQWYLFYHSMDVSGNQHLRTVCVDKIYFNEDGTIPEIKATKRGVGKMFAEEKVQIDRYSTLENARVERTKHNFVNWLVRGISEKTVLTFNDLNFENNEYTSLLAYVNSTSKGGEMLVYNGDNKLLASINLPKMQAEEYQAVKATLNFSPTEMQNLVVKFKGNVEGLKLDWVQFIPKDKAVLTTSYDVNVEYEGMSILTDGNNCLLYNPTKLNVANLKVTNASTIENLKLQKNGEKAGEFTTSKQGDVISFISSKIETFHNPYETVLAQNFSDQNGIIFQNCSLGNKNAAYIENNDNLVFDNLRFEKSPSKMEITIASKDVGGIVEVRKNSANGELLSTFKVTATGGFQKWNKTESEINGTISEDDKIFFVFKGGSGYLYNFQSFMFK